MSSIRKQLSPPVAVILLALTILLQKQAISISDQYNQVPAQPQQQAQQAASPQPTPPPVRDQTPPSELQTANGLLLMQNAETASNQQADQQTTAATNANRNTKQTNQQMVGRVRKSSRQHHGDGIGSTKTKLSSATMPTLEPASILSNTPPLFITRTRDFYLNIASYQIGSRVETFQANDQDGDRLEYSLQPAAHSDASAYFSINSTSGELYLTSRRLFEPIAKSAGKFKEGETAPAEQDQDTDDQVYNLIVLANDGHYTTLLEVRIHVVSPRRQFGAGLPVLLTPEGRLRGAERLMRAKTSEFLDSLQRSNTNLNGNRYEKQTDADNSTIVMPSILNPPLTRVNSVAPLADISLMEPDQVKGLGNSATSGLELDPNASITQATPAITRHYQEPLQSGDKLLMELVGQNHANSMRPLPDQVVLQRPMLMSVIMIIFACFTIAFVLLVFIVPISVRSLKRRLKTMERQHEQLSQKASNSGGSIGSNSCPLSRDDSLATNSMSSSTIGCSHGPPSSLSQFTLGSHLDGSCAIMSTMLHQRDRHALNCQNAQSQFRRAPLGRQSSLDSTFTSSAIQCANYVDSSQSTITHRDAGEAQSYLTASQQHRNQLMLASSMNQSNQTQLKLARHQNGPMNQRIQAGAIVNPIYLHQINGMDHPMEQQTSTTMVQDNIYCPIDDEFYSTINTETTLVDDDQIARHNYNLLHEQTGQFKSSHQLAQHHQVGSLIGQTGDSRNYFASGCAEPTSFTRRQIDQLDSPAPSISSNSSTKSLARFLSLPATRWSQPKTNDSKVEEPQRQTNDSFLQGLDLNFNSMATLRATTKTNSMEQQLAKTIARADGIQREQQVRHKRDQTNQMDASDKWEIERHKLKFLDILDEGQFGLVWRCRLKSDEFLNENCDKLNGGAEEVTVAVKTLKSFAAKEAKERDELLAEIEIMKVVCNHPNVVRILHCCTCDIGPTRPILLVMEHVKLGKLQSFLERSRANHQYATTTNSTAIGQDYRMLAGSIASSCSIIDDHYKQEPSLIHTPAAHQSNNNNNAGQQLSSRDLIKFIYHVAKGMDYVSSNRIVHRDLASRNILVSSERVCKIGDFGMARHMANMGDVYERRSNNTKVPVRWMAPEVLLANSFTTKSDVFSFGILMWEIVTLGSTPYRHLKTEEIIQAVARNGDRPERPEYCHEHLYEIMSSCWSVEPTKRPSFRELVDKLDGLLMGTEEYIQLDQYPEHNYYNLSQMAAPLELL